MKMDNFFKEQLENTGFEYSDAMWSNMQQIIAAKNLKNRRKKRAILWSLSALFLLLTTAVVGIYNYQTNERNLLGDNRKSNLISETENTIQKINTDNSNHSATGLTKNTENVNANEPINSRQSEKVDRVFTNKNSTSDFESRVLNENKMKVEEVSKHKIETDLKATDLNITSEKKEEIIAENYLKYKLNQCINFKYPNSFLDQNSMALSQVNSIAINIPYLPPKLHKKSSINFVLLPTVGRMNNLKIETNKLLNSDLQKEANINATNYAILLKAQKGMFYSSFGLSFLQFNSSNTYSKIVNTYDYRYYYILVNPNYAKSDNGSNVALIKKITDTTTTSHKEGISQNKLSKMQYISIPFSLGVQKKLGKLTVNFGLGITPMFLASSKGLYSTYNSKSELEIVNLKNSNYLNRVNLSSAAEFGLSYDLTNKILLNGGFSFNKTMFNAFKYQKQTYQYQNITLGLGIRL